MAANTAKLCKKDKRRQRDYGRRRDSFEMAYVKTKYPKIYDEATEFYNELRELYPTKCDLRKTDQFKVWKSKQEQEKGKQDTPEPPPPADNMALKIPLFDTATLTSAQSLQTISEEVLGEGTIYPSLQEEIPGELIEEVLAELRQDPDLKDLFSTVEEDFEKLGAEIEIPEDTRLEDELITF